MNIYLVSQILPRISPEIDWAKSTLLSEYTDRLKRTCSGDWRLPTRLRRLRRPVRLAVIPRGRWPQVLAWSAYGLVVTPQLAECLCGSSESCVERLAVEIETTKSAKPPPQYELVNVFRSVDALNITASRLSIDPDVPDIDILAWETPARFRHLTVDLARCDLPYRVFALKYQPDVFVDHVIAARLRRVGGRDIGLRRIRTQREPNSLRVRALTQIRKEYRRQIALRTGLASQSRSLVARLPLPTATLLKRAVNAGYTGVELYDKSERVAYTLAMRETCGNRWPKSYICIAGDGRGGCFAVDTAESRRGDFAVFYADHERFSFDKSTGTSRPHFELAAPSLSRWVSGLASGGDGLP